MQKEWIYGFHAIESALGRGALEQVLIDRKRQDKRVQKILALLNEKNIPYKMVDAKKLSEMIREENSRHQGVIGEVRVKSSLDESALYELLDRLEHPPFLLVLDGVQDPHNVGACLRSAEAFGVDALIVPKDNACGLTPIVRKVSSGSSERIPFIEVTNLVRVLNEIKERGVWTYGLSGSASEILYSTKFTGGIAIVMGSEGQGLRNLTEKNCDFLIKIPMEGEIESLNVSVATGITLSEVYRQKQL